MIMVTAEEIAALLKEAREAWSIDDASLAARAQLDPIALPAALRGEADLSDLAALVRALGGTLDDLLAGRRFWEAPAVAFKSAPSTFELPLVRTALLRISSVARDRAMLTEILALPEPEAGGPTLAPVPVAEGVTAQAEALAQRARQALTNESEPISSVREAMRRLGVWTFLTDFATPNVDGMMWRDEEGRACAAANVRARSGKLTALRMTFAHDLCHAVFDGTKLRAFGLVPLFRREPCEPLLEREPCEPLLEREPCEPLLEREPCEPHLGRKHLQELACLLQRPLRQQPLHYRLEAVLRVAQIPHRRGPILHPELLDVLPKRIVPPALLLIQRQDPRRVRQMATRERVEQPLAPVLFAHLARLHPTQRELRDLAAPEPAAERRERATSSGCHAVVGSTSGCSGSVMRFDQGGVAYCPGNGLASLRRCTSSGVQGTGLVPCSLNTASPITPTLRVSPCFCPA
jgi:hypothetical protein